MDADYVLRSWLYCIPVMVDLREGLICVPQLLYFPSGCANNAKGQGKLPAGLCVLPPLAAPFLTGLPRTLYLFLSQTQCQEIEDTEKRLKSELKQMKVTQCSVTKKKFIWDQR